MSLLGKKKAAPTRDDDGGRRATAAPPRKRARAASGLPRLKDRTACERDPYGDVKDDDEDIPTDEDSEGSLADFVVKPSEGGEEDGASESEAGDDDSEDEGIDESNIIPTPPDAKRPRRETRPVERFAPESDGEYEPPSDLSDDSDDDDDCSSDEDCSSDDEEIGSAASAFEEGGADAEDGDVTVVVVHEDSVIDDEMAPPS